ncbi:COG1355, Predicted dioxygenase [hydrothermal vent metagenome]|uniref:COG1355, Predicted dioxygenase n=1 Tax=hydrothermal vent metagenome TaxID=652676 RepID=A0A1W1BSR9_9ZZZZ
MKNNKIVSHIRKAAVQGDFYPKECSKLKATIKKFIQELETIPESKEMKNIIPQAVIVPHAGYIYSGFTADCAYQFLKRSKAKRIIVIGPSHHYYFKGISGSYFETYETPCGEIPIDSPYLFALAKQFNIGFEPEAHKKEHSTEVQMPFIQYYFPHTKVIELIYGDIEVKKLTNIILALLHNKENAVVISSDLSHFHDLEVAKAHDYSCLRAVDHLNVEILKKGCEACGLTGIQAMILAAKALKLSSKLLDYRTSADATADTKSVVGYMSAMFY